MARSPEAVAWRRLYKTRHWQQLRLAHLAKHPLCAMCDQMGRTAAATVVDHIKPHKGDEGLFFDPENLSSLCKAHHDSTKARIERGNKGWAIGADGWPIDNPA